MSKRSSFADLGDFDVITSRPPNATNGSGGGGRGDDEDGARQNQPPSKHEVTYHTLREMIAQGELRAERDFLLQPLAQRLGVSRNTLTRAMNRLVGDEVLRHTPQKGYALLTATVQQFEHWYPALHEQVHSVLIADQGAKRQRQYVTGRESKLALAELLPELPPAVAAAELEDLLRAVVARAAVPARNAQFDSNLTRLMLARRVEHLVVPEHREEVAQLMRSFYRGQYDRFLRAHEVYTAKRIHAAAQIVVKLQLWVLRADVV